MTDQIAESIDATLESVGPDDGLTIDGILPHMERSAQFQKLVMAHVSKFYAGEDPIPDRIRLAVTHSFWLGYEFGKAVEQTSKLEAMLIGRI
jgi:hypothetical protein